MVASQPPGMLYITDENGPRHSLMETLNARGLRITIANTAEDAISLLDHNDTEAAIFNTSIALSLLDADRTARIYQHQFDALEEIYNLTGHTDLDVPQMLREAVMQLGKATSDPAHISASITMDSTTYPDRQQIAPGGSRFEITLRDDQEAVGHITLRHSDPSYTFEAMDCRFIHLVGQCISRSIEHSPRKSDSTETPEIAQLQRDNTHLHKLQRMFSQIQAADSSTTIAHAIIQELYRHINFQRASLTLFDFEANEAITVASDDSQTSGIRFPIERIHTLLDQLREQQPYNQPDMYALQHPTAAEQIWIKRGVRAYTLFPLIYDNQVIGSLNLGTYSPGPLPDQAVELVCAVTETLAGAVQRSYHHEQTAQRLAKLESMQTTLSRRVDARTSELYAANQQLMREVNVRERAETAEHQQRILAESLRDIATALNSSLDLDEVLDRILASIERVLPFDAINVMLVEDDNMIRIARALGYQNHTLETVNLQDPFPLTKHNYLRIMHNTQMPLIISDTASSDLWSPRPEQSWIRSFIGAPITADNLVIGFINVKSVAPNYYQDFHLERLKMFTDQAAIAIRNARDHENAINYAMLEDRQRLARDLHDAVSQTLFSATVVAETTLRGWARSPETVQPKLEQLNRLIRGALAEMRTLLLELRPTALQDTPLPDLIRQLAEAFSGRNRCTVGVEIYGENHIPPAVKVELYRISQEALNNVSKHARARHVRIMLAFTEGRIRLQIKDDGRGFDLSAVDQGTLGLNIMRERTRNIGGRLTIDTTAGEGTVVTVEWNPSEDIGVTR